MKILKKKVLFLIITITTVFISFNTNTISAQDFGADIVSSYVWRGTQFGSGTHIQPWITLGSGNLEAGVWGSFPTTASGGGNELDMYLSYNFGHFALTITNYTFPTDNGTYGEGNPGLFDGDWMEVSGSADFGPVGLTVGYFTDAEALYIEATFPIGGIVI